MRIINKESFRSCALIASHFKRGRRGPQSVTGRGGGLTGCDNISKI